MSSQSDFRIVLGFTNGMTFAGGSAERIWDRAGQFGVGQGVHFGLGYDLQSIGFSLVFEIAHNGLAARDGIRSDPSATVAAAAMLHWRPASTLRYRVRPRLGIGYVRTGVGFVDFPPGEFPFETTGGPAVDYPIESVGTLGHGLRVTAGAERSIWEDQLDVFAEAAVDLISFRQVDHDEAGLRLTESLLNPGWSIMPKLSLGIAWRPF